MNVNLLSTFFYVINIKPLFTLIRYYTVTPNKRFCLKLFCKKFSFFFNYFFVFSSTGIYNFNLSKIPTRSNLLSETIVDNR